MLCVSGESKARPVSGGSCRGVVDGEALLEVLGYGKRDFGKRGCGKRDYEQRWWPANRIGVLLGYDPVQIPVGKLVVAVLQC